jgi:competence protein ComEA
MDIIAFLNSADASELSVHLHGVGATKAEDIVAFRSENGNFKTLHELRAVKGVGDVIISNLEAGDLKKDLPASPASSPATPPRAPKAHAADASPAGVDSFPASPSRPAEFDYTAEKLTEEQATLVTKRAEILEDWSNNKERIVQKWRQDPIKLAGKEVQLQPPLDKMYNDIIQEYDRRFQEIMDEERDHFDAMLIEAGDLNQKVIKEHGARKTQHQSAADTSDPNQLAVEAFAKLMADAAQVNGSLIASGEAITKLLGEYDPEFKCRPAHCPLKSTRTIVEKVVFKYCQDVKSTGVEGADFQKKFKRGLNDCKDIAGVTIVVNSFAGLMKALKYCDDSDANGGMEVVSIKNSFMYDEDSDEGFKTAEGHNPGDLKPLGDSEKVYHPGEEIPAGEKVERRFKKPFVMLKDGRYFQLYEKEDGGNGRCKKTDPECRGREIVLPYHGPGEWVYYNPHITDTESSYGGTGEMGAYKTMAKNQIFYDGSEEMAGWRDLLLNVRFPHINDHICELQLQHRVFTNVRVEGVDEENSIMGDEYAQCYESIPAGMEKGHTVYTAHREHFGRGLCSI